ncbi:hypothetical protein [Nocardioides sp. Root140]|uniref:hypothetical protein n=1 Tax=Nocardioides sp. Root140 TaxID=1736460 RepID=UPI000AF3701F|nr:hypothetical protein [Nocardioides sp. Root140]
MFKLIKVLFWIAIGYVLGAKAGHERYEQIARAAGKVRQSPPVQAGVAKAEETVRAQAPVVKEKAAHVASAAAEKLPFGHSEPGGAHLAPDAGSNGLGTNGTGS